MHGPLGREGRFEGEEGGFGGVVGGLGLRVVCAVGGDGGEEEDAAIGVLGDHLSETPRGEGVSCVVLRKGERAKREGGDYRAAAWAERKEPVVLISNLLFHSEADISMACVQPTTPAKQHSISTLPSSEVVNLTADSSCSAFVTSTLIDKTLALGKSVFSASISRVDFECSRSKSARPERPCSSKARAFTRARVPAPPVTR